MNGLVFKDLILTKKKGVQRLIFCLTNLYAHQKEAMIFITISVYAPNSFPTVELKHLILK